MNINPAHLHLLVNHFSIIGWLFTTFVLAYAIVKKDSGILRLSYILFIMCAAASIVAINTGEGAEHYLKSLNKVEGYYLERHIRMADIANIGMIIIGAVSILNLFIRKISNLIFMQIVILIISLMVAGLMTYTGKLGGEIMHREIRIDSSSQIK